MQNGGYEYGMNSENGSILHNLTLLLWHHYGLVLLVSRLHHTQDISDPRYFRPKNLSTADVHCGISSYSYYAVQIVLKWIAPVNYERR